MVRLMPYHLIISTTSIKLSIHYLYIFTINFLSYIL
nr:MAG TPA: hypothetical protein [Caudoviricetes sp.]